MFLNEINANGMDKYAIPIAFRYTLLPYVFKSFKGD